MTSTYAVSYAVKGKRRVACVFKVAERVQRKASARSVRVSLRVARARKVAALAWGVN